MKPAEGPQLLLQDVYENEGALFFQDFSQYTHRDRLKKNAFDRQFQLLISFPSTLTHLLQNAAHSQFYVFADCGYFSELYASCSWADAVLLCLQTSSSLRIQPSSRARRCTTLQRRRWRI